MKLSVVIPVYNVELYIRKCLESVTALPLDKKEYEIIVVNDGTPDRSMDIVQEYENLLNFRVINQINKGLGGARNTGLKEAEGDWIYFLDSDDYIDAESFIRLFQKACEEETCDIIFGNYNYVLDNQLSKGKYAIDTKNDINLSGEDFLIKHYSSVNTMVWRGIYRKSMLLENNLFFSEGVYHEDVNWTPKSIAAARRVYYSPISFYNYFIREGSIVQSAKNQKKISDLLFAYEDLLKHFSSRHKKIQEYISYSTTISLFVLNGQYGIYKNKELYERFKGLLDMRLAQDTKTKILCRLYRTFPALSNKLLSFRYASKDSKNIF